MAFIVGGGSGSSILPQGVIITAVGIALTCLMRVGTNQGWDESVNWVFIEGGKANRGTKQSSQAELLCRQTHEEV